jgi:putative membrane protein
MMSWILVLHLVSVISWFAGLFYLPRLFVYHAMSSDTISLERFKIMERKLFWGIMTPAAVLTLITGYWILFAYAWNTYETTLWLKLKIVLVFGLLIYQVFCWYFMQLFKADRNPHSHVFYRWFNEVPTILLIAIMILIFVKPF